MKMQRLITQTIDGQTITVQFGKTPVIKITSQDGCGEVIRAVNFLRAGCPAVEFKIANGQEIRYGVFERMRELILKLQESEHRSFRLCGEPEIDKQGLTVLNLHFKT
jgi:hypothetical protein